MLSSSLTLPDQRSNLVSGRGILYGGTKTPALFSLNDPRSWVKSTYVFVFFSGNYIRLGRVGYWPYQFKSFSYICYRAQLSPLHEIVFTERFTVYSRKQKWNSRLQVICRRWQVWHLNINDVTCKNDWAHGKFSHVGFKGISWSKCCGSTGLHECIMLILYVYNVWVRLSMAVEFMFTLDYSYLLGILEIVHSIQIYTCICINNIY